jgi:hypothetical protein
MTVTAATCSSRSLPPCNIRVRAVGVAQPEQSPALWIDSTGVAIRDIAGMLIAMYARNNVPHLAWLHVCNTVDSSAISQLCDMAAHLSHRSTVSFHQLQNKVAASREANDPGPGMCHHAPFQLCKAEMGRLAATCRSQPAHSTASHRIASHRIVRRRRLNGSDVLAIDWAPVQEIIRCRGIGEGSRDVGVFSCAGLESAWCTNVWAKHAD